MSWGSERTVNGIGPRVYQHETLLASHDKTVCPRKSKKINPSIKEVHTISLLVLLEVIQTYSLKFDTLKKINSTFLATRMVKTFSMQTLNQPQ